MRRRRDRIIREQHKKILALSDVCHICGHPGADAADHIIPLAQGGSDEPSNKAPAHHNVECPTCGHRCNREKGARLVPNIIRRSASLRH